MEYFIAKGKYKNGMRVGKVFPSLAEGTTGKQMERHTIEKYLRSLPSECVDIRIDHEKEEDPSWDTWTAFRAETAYSLEAGGGSCVYWGQLSNAEFFAMEKDLVVIYDKDQIGDFFLTGKDSYAWEEKHTVRRLRVSDGTLSEKDFVTLKKSLSYLLNWDGEVSA